MGRASARRVPSGRRISTSCIEAPRLAETCTTRGSRPRSQASISRSISTLTANSASSNGSRSRVEALVGGLRRRGERAAAGAHGEARGLGGAPERRLADLGRMRVAGGLAAHGAQAEALGGVVGRVAQPAVVEDQRLRPPPLEEELAVVGAVGGAAQHLQRGLGVERGLEGAETRGLRHGWAPDGGCRRGACCGVPASCPSPANMVDLAQATTRQPGGRRTNARGAGDRTDGRHEDEPHRSLPRIHRAFWPPALRRNLPASRGICR